MSFPFNIVRFIIAILLRSVIILNLPNYDVVSQLLIIFALYNNMVFEALQNKERERNSLVSKS